MVTQIKLGDIAVDVVFKDIKNVHLSVYPPEGKVRVSAPSRMKLDTLRAFVISKLAWIKQQQKKLREQTRETPREFLDRESHYHWGTRYLLKVVEDAAAPPTVVLKPGTMVLRVRPGTSEDRKDAIISGWYRQQVRSVADDLILKWELVIGVKVERLFVRRMKTKWGSCNTRLHTIRLNTELAKKPRECLEYVVVHELVHLLERHHNKRFVSLMDNYMPQWRQYRDMLNQAPLVHEDWGC